MVRAQAIASERIPSPGSSSNLWLAAGPLARVGIGPSDRLHLEALGGLWFPLVRQSFVFERPDAQVHEYPWVGWTAGVGVVLPLL